MIALVLGTDHLTFKPAAVRVIDACARAANACDAGLTLVTDSAQPNDALRNFTSDGRVAGVLIRARAANRRWVRELQLAGVPTVLLGAHRSMPDVHVVEIENVESTASLVGSMLDAGASRLAMIGGPPDHLDADERTEGFRLAHIQRGRSCDPALTFDGDFSRMSGYRLADEILDLQPDGIFAANDDMALGVMERAIQRGLSIPDDLMVAGFDGIGDYAVNTLELASVHPPFDELAMIAVETLLGLIKGMDMPRERLVDPTVRLGSTIRTDLSGTGAIGAGAIDLDLDLGEPAPGPAPV